MNDAGMNHYDTHEHKCFFKTGNRGPNLCDGCKHFLQHCIGLSSSPNTGLDVKTSGTGAGNKSAMEVKGGGSLAVLETSTLNEQGHNGELF